MTRALPLPLRCCAALLGAALPLASPAQTAAPAAGDAGWRQCAALAGDSQARLACFDRWAGEQAWQAPAADRKSVV